MRGSYDEEGVELHLKEDLYCVGYLCVRVPLARRGCVNVSAVCVAGG